jgi:hypothetical protein
VRTVREPAPDPEAWRGGQAGNALVDRKYRRLFSSRYRRRKPGPKGPSAALIAAIVEMKRRNPRFGCVRIAQKISHAFGIEIDKDVVRRVLAKHYRPGDSATDGLSWLTFIGHVKDSLWRVDLFRCETMLLRSHWVLVAMAVFTRRIIGFGVHCAYIDGVSICQMLNHAVAGQPYRDASAPITIRSSAFTGGSPTFASSISTRSSWFRTHRSRIRSSTA